VLKAIAKYMLGILMACAAISVLAHALFGGELQPWRQALRLLGQLLGGS